MYPFVMMISLFHRIFVSVQMKCVHVRCVGCEGEGNSGVEEEKIGRKRKGL